MVKSNKRKKEKKNEQANNEERSEFGFCELHDEELNIDKFRWKGCWGCHHFSKGNGFRYLDVHETSEILTISESTVWRWIKKGKLEGNLFSQIRVTGSLPSTRKFFITKESVKKLQLMEV